MYDSPKIVMVGGGSVLWSPKLITDLALTPGLEKARYVILDIDEEMGQKMTQLGRMIAKSLGLNCTFDFTRNQKEAFTEADFVIITISTGDLDAMEYDLKIPEDYKIYQTVGDTVGPGGWARSLRNIPVFAEMAKNIEKYSNNAVVLNYTNPMSTLTGVFYKVSNLRVIGLCHSLFENFEVLMKIFDLQSEDDIKVRVAGINHFFWMLDIKIKGEDGYKLLREKMNGRPFAELVIETYIDEAGFDSDKWVCSELFDYVGYLPYIGDRHICEFVPYYLVGNTERIAKYKLKRTSIEDRRLRKQKAKERLNAYLDGTLELPSKRSKEQAADIIAAFVNGKEIVDVGNLPNTGQISNLPAGSIVETLAVVNAEGFIPLSMGTLPQQVLNLVQPHVVNQNMLVEAGMEGDLDKAFWALYNDPLCAHLTLPEIKEMGMKLLKAHKRFLPQFNL